MAGAAPQQVDPRELAGQVRTNVLLRAAPEGLTLPIERSGYVSLPFPGARGIELELEADSGFTLSYGHEGSSLQGPPWRYRWIEPGRTRLELHLLQCVSWSRSAWPSLAFAGSGTLTLRELRVDPGPADEEAALRDFDRAQLLAPMSVGFTTINFLPPATWSAVRKEALAPRIALAAAAAGLLVLGAGRVLRRRTLPRLALASGALTAFLLADAHFLARYLPMLALRPRPSPEARIRENYAFDRELGALAVLARRTLGAEERVGVMASQLDLFGPLALCFNLFPRRCGVMRPGESLHPGLAGVDLLRDQELDAIVYFRSERRLPPEFEPVASVSRHAFVARRR